MIVTNEGLLPPSSRTIRSESYVKPRAMRMRAEPGSATMKVNKVAATIEAWVHSGRQVLAPHGDRLVMDRWDSWRDVYVWPSKGGPVFKELPLYPLLEPSMAFHEDDKRTMLRIMAKADQEMKTALDIRLLSAMFWIAAYIAITDRQA